MDWSKMTIRVMKMSDPEHAGDIRANVKREDRLGVVWQLSRLAYAFKGEPIAEPRLYRHIVRLHRPRG